MSSAIVGTFRPARAGRLQALSALEARVRDRLATYAPNTQRALKADWTVWHTWCLDARNHDDGLPRSAFPITPVVLVEFIRAHSPGEVRAADGTRSVDERLTHRRVKSGRTLARYLASLRALHRLAGYKDDPTADADVESARRLVMRGRTRARAKKPLRLAQIEEVLALEPKTTREKRDRAMLAVAYSAMLRRSELVALEMRDLAFDPDGSGTVTVRFGKGDQEGQGHVRFLAPFAVFALTEWFDASGIAEGSLFRAVLPNGEIAAKSLNDHEVARIFKRFAARVGSTLVGVVDIAGHSTRIGAAHDLVEAGFDVAAIANAGGWKSLMMPNYYTRELRAKQSAMAQLIQGRETGAVKSETTTPRRAPTMKLKVTQFKSLKTALKELEPFIRDGRHLYTGKPFRRFGNLRSRELLANWLICAVLNEGRAAAPFTFTSDPQGGDGIIYDRETDTGWQTEHVMVVKAAPKAQRDVATLITTAVNSKQEKGGAAYARGKVLVVFLDAGSGEWHPNRVASQLAPVDFKEVWVVGLHGLVTDQYVYGVTQLKPSAGNAPTCLVRIAKDFDAWNVIRLQ